MSDIIIDLTLDSSDDNDEIASSGSANRQRRIRPRIEIKSDAFDILDDDDDEYDAQAVNQLLQTMAHDYGMCSDDYFYGENGNAPEGILVETATTRLSQELVLDDPREKPIRRARAFVLHDPGCRASLQPFVTVGWPRRRGIQQQRLTGFVLPEYTGDDDNDPSEWQDAPFLVSLAILNTHVNMGHRGLSFWVETASAWYRLEDPRTDYLPLYLNSTLDFRLAHRLADIVQEDMDTPVWEPRPYEFAAKLTMEHDLPVECDVDVADLLAVLLHANDADGHERHGRPGIESLWIWAPEIREFLVHPIVRAARDWAAATGILEDDAALKALPRLWNRTAMLAKGTIPAAATPRVHRVLREDREFAVFPNVGCLGPPIDTPSLAPVLVPEIVVCDNEQHQPCVDVGSAVRFTSNWATGTFLVHSLTADGELAHVVKLVKTKETMVGAFGHDDIWIPTSTCRWAAVNELCPVQPHVLQLYFARNSYVSFDPDGPCPSCVAEPPPARASADLLSLDPLAFAASGAQLDLLTRDAALLSPTFPSLPLAHVPRRWHPAFSAYLHQGDHVYFIPPGADTRASSTRLPVTGLKKDQGVYMIGEIQSLSAESVTVRLLGRWDALRHPHGVPSHERRLFDTKVIVSVPLAVLAGMVTVVPLPVASVTRYFDGPKNFAHIGAVHPFHDPREHAFAASWCARPPKRPASSPRALRYYQLDSAVAQQTLVNRSPFTIYSINAQLAALAAWRGLNVGDAPNSDVSIDEPPTDANANVPPPIAPLIGLDLFSGCGGLTVGFDRGPLATTSTRWAIEFDAHAAAIFQRNVPEATVIQADAGAVLRAMVDPSTASKHLPDGFDASQLPKSGDVGMLYCGPPCQGFSGMNQNRTNEDHKNALILTALSYVEVLRPTVFLLENVTGMLGFRLGAVRRAKGKVETGGYTMGVPRLIVRVLLDLGYQVGWSVLQVGAFGSCQSRRRVIFVTTLPHVKLPVFPEPMYLFRTESVKMATYDPALRSIDDDAVDMDDSDQVPPHWRHDEEPNQEWNSTLSFVSDRWALFPPRFVRDAISDLPGFDYAFPAASILGTPQTYQDAMRFDPSLPVVDGCKTSIGASKSMHLPPHLNRYTSAPRSDMQRQLRAHEEPTTSSCRIWQGLERNPCFPAAAHGLAGGTVAVQAPPLDHVVRTFNPEVIERIYHITRRGHRNHQDLPNRLKPGTVKGLEGGPRDSKLKALYGRLAWRGFTHTITTTCDPMRKAGTIIHPHQHRIVSVREMARFQTFPDDFSFDTGAIDVREAYRQIGNAVPPLLAAAINQSIYHSLLVSPLAHLCESDARRAMGLPPL
ncbi:hypothetical protein BC828DRAFT_404432 [Blastocladiella britannica]|nr:hypothetical protein BC828DRAFT_404432 [Blastocladiella britannica]